MFGATMSKNPRGELSDNNRLMFSETVNCLVSPFTTNSFNIKLVTKFEFRDDSMKNQVSGEAEIHDSVYNPIVTKIVKNCEEM